LWSFTLSPKNASPTEESLRGAIEAALGEEGEPLYGPLPGAECSYYQDEEDRECESEESADPEREERSWRSGWFEPSRALPAKGES
jgi:hypothetical protein